ncbi:hypothetical protein ABFV47_07405 [Mycolicibacterium fortuitum]|uniref:hypothetical protein n=1 Tax=Mycolicibacterium TaxID=1866885 RepID=UPI0032048FDE
MSNLHVGGQVRIQVRGVDLPAVIVALTRSRATVEYTDTHGEKRATKVPIHALTPAGVG